MKLIEIGALRWQVLAHCDHRQRCNVLDVLLGLQSPAAQRMLRTLRTYIPERGPSFHNKEKVKHLQDGIFELREQPHKGPKPRVFFFRDANLQVIVTTDALAKRDDRIDQFIKSAKKIRSAYNDDKALGHLEIEQL